MAEWIRAPFQLFGRRLDSYAAEQQVEPRSMKRSMRMTDIPHVIVLGTHNRKKGRELALLLAPFGLEVLTLDDVEAPLEVEENGDSFAANAALKACQQAIHLQQWVLGEDSGLIVPALSGAPGVYSARYAGPDATDGDNVEKLLREMSSITGDRRGAYYVSHMTLADPTGRIRSETETICRGRIADVPRGTAGFGYDPVFEIVEYHRTFGELGDTVKGMLSHRGRATRLLVPRIVQILERVATDDKEQGSLRLA